MDGRRTGILLAVVAALTIGLAGPAQGGERTMEIDAECREWSVDLEGFATGGLIVNSIQIEADGVEVVPTTIFGTSFHESGLWPDYDRTQHSVRITINSTANFPEEGTTVVQTQGDCLPRVSVTVDCDGWSVSLRNFPPLPFDNRYTITADGVFAFLNKPFQFNTTRSSDWVDPTLDSHALEVDVFSSADLSAEGVTDHTVDGCASTTSTTVPGGSTTSTTVPPSGDTGTVVAVVKYKTDSAKSPLGGVQVHLDDGSDHFACTDATGKVTFEGISSGVDLRISTGRSDGASCVNAEFLNPDNGLKMLANHYLRHHGVREFTTFQIEPGEKRKVFLTVKTPKGQGKICAGLLTTWRGTAADDVFLGTGADEVLNGRGGADHIDGAGGNDIICGGKVGDQLIGGSGDDLIFGEKGNDEIDGGPGNDTVIGGVGDDACNAEAAFQCESLLTGLANTNTAAIPAAAALTLLLITRRRPTKERG